MTSGVSIWRRTRVGAGLTLAAGALLWLAACPVGPTLTLLVGLVLTLWGLVEAARIGVFGDARLALSAAVAACAPPAVLWALLDPSSTFELGALTSAQRYLVALAAAPLAALVVAFAAALPALGAGAPRPLGAFARRVLALAVPLAALYPLRLHLGVEGLVAVVLLAKIGDVFGYFVGSLIGRSHPFPRISPGKTLAGCVASLVAGVLAGYGVQALELLPPARFGALSGLLLGGALNVAAQAGDLLESALKRRCGVKDSATTFGPSGGVLDLVDSLTCVAPLALVAGPLLFHWPYLAAQ
jgi:phosphatidate cytidylyltransferase